MTTTPTTVTARAIVHDGTVIDTIYRTVVPGHDLRRAIIAKLREAGDIGRNAAYGGALHVGDIATGSLTVLGHYGWTVGCIYDAGHGRVTIDLDLGGGSDSFMVDDRDMERAWTAHLAWCLHQMLDEREDEDR